MGALWVGLQVCLAGVPFPAGGFGLVMRRTPANAKALPRGVVVDDGGGISGREGVVKQRKTRSMNSQVQ